MARRVFKRTRGGALVVTLYAEEVELLAMTARDMVPIVAEPPAGDVRDRLYPRAYLDPTEEQAQGEYDALVHDDLVQSRQAALATIVAGIEGVEANRRGLVEVTLSAEQELQWLTGLNDARLVIGTALGVTEDGDTDFEPSDPRFEYGVLYGWLTQLHFALVTLLLDDLGEDGTDDPLLDPPGAPRGEMPRDDPGGAPGRGPDRGPGREPA
jgi:Domain of unknown function (DUF2017)